jgi:hypothetical protein
VCGGACYSLQRLLRRSKIRELTVDEHSLERAEHIKKNLEEPGTSCCKSFLTFTDSHIASNISELGISMGKDIQQGICNLKSMERDRVAVVHKRTDLDATNNSELLEDD